MIKIAGLVKKYGNKTAVDGISLEVKPGEIFGILGPNGAGKTTTIKMVSGILKPTLGNIEIFGFDIKKNPIEAKRITGLLPDRPFVYQKLTGREFLEFTCGIYGVDPGKKIDELLGYFSLSENGNDLIESYSHGMQQKLVLISILIRNPKLILLDEPLVGLDPKSARLVKEIYVAEAKKGVIVFLSTHILEIAEKLCDRLAIIDKGRIVAMGTLEELKKHAKAETNLEEVFLKLTEKENEN